MPTLRLTAASRSEHSVIHLSVRGMCGSIQREQTATFRHRECSTRRPMTAGTIIVHLAAPSKSTCVVPMVETGSWRCIALCRDSGIQVAGRSARQRARDLHNSLQPPSYLWQNRRIAHRRWLNHPLSGRLFDRAPTQQYQDPKAQH